MQNQQIYQRDPSTRKLINEGVASVNDLNEEVLRYELETFVCDGQYQKGMEDILRTFLDNVRRGAPQQPGSWVSGFYGSGKSHLVKMLQALWCNSSFQDGATALGVTQLPQPIQDLFKELTIEARRHGGLHAASGTLKANDDSNSVRSALLAIIFKSVGLPAKYHLASFVMWLAEEGLLELLKEKVQKAGRDWDKEVQRLHVSEVIREGLVELRPKLFFDAKTCAETLRNQFPSGKDVSNDEMLQAINQCLTRDGKFPLTLIILDEVQQYIGTSAERSIDVQESVEACSRINGKLMFIGTGQTAVTGTSNLKKLEGRFTLRIELSDTDVEAVIRKVILAKKPDAVKLVARVMEQNLGEISRHLSGSAVAHRQDDIAHFPQDYPILPVRRRFWENTLRVLDQTGTDSQLRNQLTMIHKAIQSNLDQPLGHVVAGDYLYFDGAEKLLQARILPRKVHETTLNWYSTGTEEQKLLARACGLVFLINKLTANNNEIGIQANVDTLADLLVEDLTAGSGALRSKLPKLLDGCQLLMKVGEEYRIQTEESALWNDEYLSQRNRLGNEAYRIEAERDDRVRQNFAAYVKQRVLTHGAAKVPREITPVFDAQLPKDHNQRIYLWVRDGWSVDENSVRAEALQAGSKSPTVFIFIPKRSADDLRNALIDLKAAQNTLEMRGVPTPGSGGEEAKLAMETTRNTAEGKVKLLLKEAFSGAKVYQGGGTEIVGNSLQEMVIEAAENSLQRLYPRFGAADHPGWDKVYAKAKQGAPDALVAVGDSGEPANNAVCKEVIGFIAAGKTGADIRANFQDPPYGWSQDAVDGALQTLLVAGLIRAQDEKGSPLDPRDIDRKAISKTQYRVEATTITVKQRIEIRKVLQGLGVTAKAGEELLHVPVFLDKLRALAESAGGEAPKPATPDMAFIDQIRLSVGNEQLLQIFNRKDDLQQAINEWQSLAKRIGERWPAWQQLKELAQQTNGLQHAETYRLQVKNIEEQRMLLDDPDPGAPLLSQISQQLREELNRLDGEYKQLHGEGMSRLQADENWQQLEPEQKNQLLAGQKLSNAYQPKIEVQTTPQVLATLRSLPISQFADQIAALPGRFNRVLEQAAELCEPELTFVDLPKRSLNSEDELKAYLAELESTIKSALKNGPVRVR